MEGDDSKSADKSHRHMVEDIAVTPFFKKHRGHMAATVKLHAEVWEEDDKVYLKTGVEGYTEEDVEVSATPNSIDVTLVLERRGGQEVKFHSSYVTPSPIESDHLGVKLKDGVLKVSAPKK